MRTHSEFRYIEGQDKNILCLCKWAWSSVGPTQNLTKKANIKDSTSLSVKCPERYVVHLPPNSDENEDVESLPTPPLRFHGVVIN